MVKNIILLFIGGVIGFMIYWYINVDNIPSFSLTNPSNKLALVDAPIDLDSAKDHINGVREIIKNYHQLRLNVADSISWAIKVSSLKAIINQIGPMGDSTYYIRFYPAFDKTGDSLTFVFIGEDRYRNLIHKKYIRDPNGNIQGTKDAGEIWDFIGPCPFDCPPKDILKLEN